MRRRNNTGATKTHSLSQFGHRKSGIKPPARLIKAPGDHAKMSSARSADRRKRPRSGFGTALVPLSRPPLFPRKPFVFQKLGPFFGKILPGPHPFDTCFLAANCGRITRSTEIAAWVIRVAVTPLFHQCLKLGIVPVGQNNSDGDEQVPGSPRLGHTLALEAEGAAAGGIFRNRQFHCAAERRHPNLAAQHRLIERNGQIQAQITALDLEVGMRRDADRNQEIARRVARRGFALPLQPDLLAGDDACRDPDIELLAGRQADALFPAFDRLLQRHRHGDVQIEIEADPAGVEFEGPAAAGTSAPGRAAEHAVEDILKTCPARAAGTAAGAEAGFEAARSTGAAARVAAGKTLEAWLALGVDLAAVELLALVLVADDLVGGIDLGKARSRLRIVLVVVRVMLLGELAIGTLDRRSAGAPRHPQDLIGVTHPSGLLHGNSVLKLRTIRPLWLYLGSQLHFCTYLQRLPAKKASLE